MINYISKWVGGDILDELDLHCKAQPKSRLYVAMVKQANDCVLRDATVLIFMDSKLFHDELAINRLLVPVVFMWE